MNVDCHMHTTLCGHAIGAPLEYAMAALEKGIDLITITCHIPMAGEAFGQAGIRMRRDQLEGYIALVEDTAEQARAFDVEVLCGIEAEVFPDEAHMESRFSVGGALQDFVLARCIRIVQLSALAEGPQGQG